MKNYTIIKRESKSGINLRVKPEGNQHPFGFEELPASIPADNLPQASAILKQVVKDTLTQIYRD